MAEQNQLSKVSDATKALGVTSSLPPNKAITVSELDSLISQLPSTAAEILGKINLTNQSLKNKVLVVNTTSEKIQVYPTAYPNAQVNVNANSYIVTGIRPSVSLEISKDAFIVYIESYVTIVKQIVSHGTINTSNEFTCVIIY
jgi:hypothetical protein